LATKLYCASSFAASGLIGEFGCVRSLKKSAVSICLYGFAAMIRYFPSSVTPPVRYHSWSGRS